MRSCFIQYTSLIIRNIKAENQILKKSRVPQEQLPACLNGNSSSSPSSDRTLSRILKHRSKITWTERQFLKAANYNMNEAMKAYVAANSKYSVEVPLNQIFDSLRGKSDPKDSIGIESSMNYLTETLCVNLENAEMFVALEAVRAPSIGQITRQSFVDGWMAKNVPVDNKAHAACIRDCTAALSRDSAYFKTVYRYAFVVGKEPDQKSLSLENAAIYWTMLFTAPGWEWKTSRHNWLDLWLEYLKEHYSRPVNKDMWNQTLEFARRAVEDETLSFWSEDGAWPGVIDDFVAWFYEKFEDPRKKGDYEEDEGSD